MAKIQVESDVSGNVWKIEVNAGDIIKEGDVLMILESMKMEIPVESSVSGKVLEILVKTEQQVSEGQVVAVLEA